MEHRDVAIILTHNLSLSLFEHLSLIFLQCMVSICLNELVESATLRVEANWKVLWKMIVLPEVRNVICGQQCAIACQHVLARLLDK